MIRFYILRVLIRTIRKYAPEGLDVICGSDGSVIAYRWAWSKELEDMLNGKRKS